MDLVFTLFGKNGAQAVQALGEAYVNLKEMTDAGFDLAPPGAYYIYNHIDLYIHI